MRCCVCRVLFISICSVLVHTRRRLHSAVPARLCPASAPRLEAGMGDGSVAGLHRHVLLSRAQRQRPTCGAARLWRCHMLQRYSTVAWRGIDCRELGTSLSVPLLPASSSPFPSAHTGAVWCVVRRLLSGGRRRALQRRVRCMEWTGLCCSSVTRRTFPNRPLAIGSP